jgi:hypothetical protein
MVTFITCGFITPPSQNQFKFARHQCARDGDQPPRAELYEPEQTHREV